MHERFDVDYLVLDDFGVKEILCMSCGKKIKSRMEIRSSKFGGQIFRELSKHNNYREIPVVREDNSISFVMVCDDCYQLGISDLELPDVTEQIRSALKKQLLWEGKPFDFVEAIANSKVSPVSRMAEPSDIKGA